jgi:hypothetical protein
MCRKSRRRSSSFVERRLVPRLQVVDGRVEGAAGAGVGAQAIDGAAARDRHHPRRDVAALRVELAGAPPDLDERLLDDVLGVVRVAQDAPGDRERAPAVLLEQLAERLDVARGDPGQQAPVALAVAPLVLALPRGALASLGAVGVRRGATSGPPAHDENMRTPRRRRRRSCVTDR